MRKGVYVAIGLAFMLYNSLYQYSWNAVYPLLLDRFDKLQLSVIFSTFVVVSSVSQVLGGLLADYFSVRRVSVASALMTSLGWLLSSATYDYALFLAVWSVGSFGEGVLYGVAINLASKWYVERRGFYVGLVSLGFGLGGFIANPWILMQRDYYSVALVLGLIGLAVVFPLSFLVSYPSGLAGKSPARTVREVSFWLLYFSFVISTLPLLLLSSSLYLLVKGTGVEALAIIAFPLASGLARPLFGRISDSLGRAKSLMIAMGLEAVGVLSLLGPAELRLLGTVLVGLSGGALLTLFLTFVTDIFGARYSTSNTAILYTGKAVTGVVLAGLQAVEFPVAWYFAFPLVGAFLLINAERTAKARA
ncbi:MAG: MFS transporter [Thermoprotei archaeon]